MRVNVALIPICRDKTLPQYSHWNHKNKPSFFPLHCLPRTGCGDKGSLPAVGRVPVGRKGLTKKHIKEKPPSLRKGEFLVSYDYLVNISSIINFYHPIPCWGFFEYKSNSSLSESKVSFLPCQGFYVISIQSIIINILQYLL